MILENALGRQLALECEGISGQGPKCHISPLENPRERCPVTKG